MPVLIEQRPYSYRGDPSVPDFDDGVPITFMDGQCTLCSTGARLISRLDRQNEFRICPIDTALGRSVLSHYGLDPDDPKSWLYLVEGRTDMCAVPDPELRRRLIA